jgi:cobalamin synthase
MTDLQPLTQYVIDSAHQEVATKAKKSVPALKMGAVAGTFGVLAAAASYRLSVLLLEKVMPSEAAALTATVAYGSGAGCAAVVALRRPAARHDLCVGGQGRRRRGLARRDP